MKHKHFEFHGGHITWTGKEPPSKEIVESFEELWLFVQDIDRRTSSSRLYGPNPMKRDEDLNDIIRKGFNQ